MANNPLSKHVRIRRTRFQGACIPSVWTIAVFLLFSAVPALGAASADSSIQLSKAPTLEDAGFSILRLLGAFALVIALFFAGIWLLRNWQRVAHRHGALARLNILEAKSLGNRQLLFVVGYDQQRMLIGASPGGITLLTLLPESTDGPAEPAAPNKGFSAALISCLTRKPNR